MDKSSHKMRKLRPEENLFLGVSAGVCTKLINYPLLNWKNTVQQGAQLSAANTTCGQGHPSRASHNDTPTHSCDISRLI